MVNIYIQEHGNATNLLEILWCPNLLVLQVYGPTRVFGLLGHNISNTVNCKNSINN